MQGLDDGSIDLTITSPPYDEMRTYQGFSFSFDAVATELYRTTADGGCVVWIVGDATIDGSESGTSFRQALRFKELGFKLHDTMIYQKAGSRFPGNVRYGQTFEYMFVLSKGKPKTINLLRDRKNKYVGTGLANNSERNRDGSMHRTCAATENKRRTEYGYRFNVWKYSTGRGQTAKDHLWVNHPAVFPLQLAKDHILTWSNPNDLVFDPFCGSGQTPIAAALLGRRYLGFDISPDYVALANERLRLYGNIG